MKQTIAQQIKWDFEASGLLEIKDKNGRLIYWENSHGDWGKWEYDSQDNEIYHQNSDGVIIDNRIPEIIEHTNGRKYKLIK